MKKFFDVVVDDSTGRPVAGATVRVRAQQALGQVAIGLASLYTDSNGTPTAVLGQVTTLHDGYYEFFAADGYYTLDFLFCGSALKTIPDVEISSAINIASQLGVGTPPGYGIILSIGQSNNVGQGLTLDPTLDVGSPRVFQFPDAGIGADTAIPAIDPLHSRGDIEPVTRIGNAVSAARAYLPTLAANRSILIVPMAVNGAGFRSGQWCAPSASGRYAELQIKAYLGGGTAGYTITFPLSAGGTVTVTLVASGASGNQINVGADAAGLLTNLQTWLAAHVATLPFTTGTVTTITETLPDGSTLSYSELVLTAKTAGVAGNALSVTQSSPFSFLLGGQGGTLTFGCGADAAGGGLYVEALAQVNQAMVNGAGSNRLAWIDWQQGESDQNVRPARYALEMDALFAALRANITGATVQTPVIIGGQVPEYVNEADETDANLVAKIHRIHRATPSRVQYSAFVPANTGSNSVALGESIFHHDAPTQRALGAAKAAALTFAQRNALIGATGAFVLSASPGASLGTISLSWTLPPSGSSRFTSLTLRYRKVSGSWTTVSLPAIATSWTLTGLDLATGYEIQLQGANEQGAGSWSNTATATTGAVPHLLDDLILTASAIFSLRKVRAAYAGHCLKVRRASPSATMDIDFNANGMIDTATVETFLAGSDGFVDTWYDQSGNARDAVQATTGSQPRIAVVGLVNRRGGIPYVDFYDNGATCVFMANSAGFPVAADFTVAATAYEPTGAGTMHLVGPGASGNHSLLLDHRPTLFIDGQTVSAPVSLPAGGPYHVAATYQVSDGSIAIYQGGVQKATGTIDPGAHAVANGVIQLGTYQSTDGFQLVGSMYQAMVLPSKLNSTQMAALGAAAAAQWGAL